MISINDGPQPKLLLCVGKGAFYVDLNSFECLLQKQTIHFLSEGIEWELWWVESWILTPKCVTKAPGGNSPERQFSANRTEETPKQDPKFLQQDCPLLMNQRYGAFALSFLQFLVSKDRPKLTLSGGHSHAMKNTTLLTLDTKINCLLFLSCLFMMHQDQRKWLMLFSNELVLSLVWYHPRSKIWEVACDFVTLLRRSSLHSSSTRWRHEGEDTEATNATQWRWTPWRHGVKVTKSCISHYKSGVPHTHHARIPGVPHTHHARIPGVPHTHHARIPEVPHTHHARIPGLPHTQHARIPGSLARTMHAYLGPLRQDPTFRLSRHLLAGAEIEGGWDSRCSVCVRVCQSILKMPAQWDPTLPPPAPQPNPRTSAIAHSVLQVLRMFAQAQYFVITSVPGMLPPQNQQIAVNTSWVFHYSKIQGQIGICANFWCCLWMRISRFVPWCSSSRH